ncbi:nedd8-activating enzyme e1 regulatory subunit [Phtheirospermum japonicum]|uniref:Nedd8-activating enzyme e1 regulatory subunit n=1 Tax=Phtheirospermum japonicum TaxID=374723 RepID=A0A830BA85_9LAMI|nr:nedd8-activating enzyme e1 regulatory subunit [Phtheirospermum japonicum]
MMLLDTFLYGAIGLYFDKVLHKETGVRYTWISRCIQIKILHKVYTSKKARYHLVEDEYNSPAQLELQKYLSDEDYSIAIGFYILLRAVDRFAANYNSFPGQFDGPKKPSPLAFLPQTEDLLYQYSEEVAKLLQLDLSRQIHDQALALEITNLPKTKWGKTENNLRRPFAEGSSSSNDKGGAPKKGARPVAAARRTTEKFSNPLVMIEKMEVSYIGQCTYSNVYRARDLDEGKIVDLKKVSGVKH